MRITKQEPRGIFTADNHYVGYMYPAADEDVDYVVNLSTEPLDGETASEWVWLRLRNGDLCLAKFPQDDAYLSLEGTFK